jgi:hypothetical protein
MKLGAEENRGPSSAGAIVLDPTDDARERGGALMSLFAALGVVIGAGAIGVVLKAFASNNGDIILTRPVKDAQNSKLTFRPRFLGNIVVGAFAAG